MTLAEALHFEFLHHVIELLLKEAVFACTQRKNQVITSCDPHHLSVFYSLTPADEPVMHAELLQLIHDIISFSVKSEQLYLHQPSFLKGHLVWCICSSIHSHIYITYVTHQLQITIYNTTYNI